MTYRTSCGRILAALVAIHGVASIAGCSASSSADAQSADVSAQKAAYDRLVVQHVVAHGDTFGKIAERYGLEFSRDELKAVNPGVNWSDLRTGQKINLPGYYYVVQPGDTLSALAQDSALTPQIIGDLNWIADLNLIQIGQVLRLPSRSYVIEPGDTLTKIADAAGLRVSSALFQKIAVANGLADPNLIQANKTIILPPSTFKTPEVAAKWAAIKAVFAEEQLVENNLLSPGFHQIVDEHEATNTLWHGYGEWGTSYAFDLQLRSYRLFVDSGKGDGEWGEIKHALSSSPADDFRKDAIAGRMNHVLWLKLAQNRGLDIRCAPVTGDTITCESSPGQAAGIELAYEYGARTLRARTKDTGEVKTSTSPTNGLTDVVQTVAAAVGLELPHLRREDVLMSARFALESMQLDFGLAIGETTAEGVLPVTFPDGTRIEVRLEGTFLKATDGELSTAFGSVLRQLPEGEPMLFYAPELAARVAVGRAYVDHLVREVFGPVAISHGGNSAGDIADSDFEHGGVHINLRYVLGFGARDGDHPASFLIEDFGGGTDIEIVRTDSAGLRDALVQTKTAIEAR